jgi:hypothetical protein
MPNVNASMQCESVLVLAVGVLYTSPTTQHGMKEKRYYLIHSTLSSGTHIHDHSTVTAALLLPVSAGCA